MKTIAIIEDDRSILEMYKIKFQAEGFTVYTAVNGEEGLEVLSGTKPDVVLLDLMMPVMGGKDMLAKLRETTWGKKIPVIIMTNISKDEAPAGLEDLDIADYVIKASSTPHLVFEKASKVLG